jgi:hypothetical protein
LDLIEYSNRNILIIQHITEKENERYVKNLKNSTTHEGEAIPISGHGPFPS